MFVGKEVRIFLKGQAKEKYVELQNNSNAESKIILNSFERVKDILINNPQYGNPIKKELIPKQFKNLGIQNLYRVELANFWRVLYTIEGNNIEILIFVMTLSDHKAYDKILGYK